MKIKTKKAKYYLKWCWPPREWQWVDRGATRFYGPLIVRKVSY